MLMPKSDRTKIYQYLFQEGVLVAKKDFEIQHDDIETRNLYVIKSMQSLTSKGYVKTQFSWQYYYYTLTDEGLEYLREWLNVPEGIVPKTLLVDAVPERAQGRRFNPRRGDDEGYRRRNRD
ncbi:40S ribosomal protein S10-A [Brettanomyces nanus]|uniref:40S ribosomal protein S10-A n=1 Tax=Eeniella nana TaxID=13502 RepID=A0A875S4Z8_EENNA|nr:40S ribosomal protein S10-A [Brettanomyces nanus]QPG75435.1 40S ribosomal protein S10-A [Brettanomyces nanus]